MRNMLSVLFITAVAAGAAAAQGQAPGSLACATPAPHAEAPEEMAQFDFLVGTFESDLILWDAEAEDWGQTVLQALWEGEYIMNGRAVADYWYRSRPGDDIDGAIGVNIRMYDEEAGLWRMTWLASDAERPWHLEAQMEEDELVMRQVFPEQTGQGIRVSKFVAHDADHWTRYTYAQGETALHLIFKIDSTRVPCRS